MRYLAFLFLIISFAFTTFAQDGNKSSFKEPPKVVPVAEASDEEAEFNKAIAEKDAATRVNSLKQFVENFPESGQRNRALGLIVSGRAELADIKLKENETEEGIKLFKLAVQEAPKPISDRLYTGIILQIPNNLFFRGQRVAGMEIAKLIEEKVADDPNQLLALSSFYLGVEDSRSAIRVAEKVIELNPETKGVYQALGLAQRFSFNLEKSAEAYSQALELNKDSISTKNSLAEMKRATGKADEAIMLYKEILEADATNLSARTGLILSLFDAGKVFDAEARMNKFLEEQPNNLFLLVGAAYWYAAKGNGEKAIDLSRQALAIEPRYTWGYIALARGLVQTGDPVEAERVLLTARKYGSFPTLQYEIANARLAAGFYKDAADELKQNFVLEDGILTTNLGGRFAVEADNFTDLLSLERRAGIFQVNSAGTKEDAEKLKKLLKFSQKLEAEEPAETEVIEAADEFISGDDKMKTHRQLYAADQMLSKKIALSKVLEITKDATKGVDEALSRANPSPAVLADELYEARRLALIKGEVLVVPRLSRPMLDSILRGRIEEISGWALFKQENNTEATVRLKRAASVMPKDSVWMRSTMWRMGTVAEVEGKDEEALSYYIKGYVGEDNDVKKTVIESLYKKINGSLDGLKERLEAKPEEEIKSPVFLKKDAAAAVSKTEQEEKEKTDNSFDPTKKTPDVVPVKDDAEVSNAAKLPEDINLNVLDQLETKTTTPTTENKTTTEPSKENKIINESAILKTPVIDESQPKTDETKTEISTEKNSDGENVEDLTTEKPPEVKSDESEIPNELSTEKTSTDETKVENRSETEKSQRPVIIISNDLSKKTEIIEPAVIKLENRKIDEEKTSENKSENEESKSIVKADPDELIKVDPTINTEKEKTTAEDAEKTKSNAEIKNETPLDNKNVNENLLFTRPRVVITENIEPAKDETPTCAIKFNQDSLTIINNGESKGVFVVVEKESKNTDVTAVSSSPNDVEAVFNPEIGIAQGLAFFFIRSISSNTGDFIITFDTPCGKKQMPVKVR